MNYRDFLQKVIYHVIDPLIKGMLKCHITPNVVTTLGFIGNMVAAALFVMAPTMPPTTIRMPISTQT